MAEVDGRSDDGETPLHRAAQFNGNPAMVTALTESGADADAKRNDGQTPLHRAAGYNENPAIVTALLSAMASVNVADDNGSTPLDVAQNPAVIAALRAAGGECGEGRAFADDTCQTDTAPRFTGMVDDQTYTVGEAITPLELPEATGGNGELSYSLEPEVAGLVFDPVARTLSGTPQTAGSYPMLYRAVDADANTADSDAATQSFTITVEPPDTAPIFTSTVEDQSYTVGEPIAPLELPAATGGNGELSYSLEPEVAGLVFDPVTRTLSGTPTVRTYLTSLTYTMTYKVQDADKNTADSDAAVLMFDIIIEVRDEILNIYRGTGDQVFHLNPYRESLIGTALRDPPRRRLRRGISDLHQLYRSRSRWLPRQTRPRPAHGSRPTAEDRWSTPHTTRKVGRHGAWAPMAYRFEHQVARAVGRGRDVPGYPPSRYGGSHVYLLRLLRCVQH